MIGATQLGVVFFIKIINKITKQNGEFNMITNYEEGYLFVHYNSQYRIYNPYLLEQEDELDVDDFIVEDREFNQYILDQPLSKYSTKATNEPWYELAVEACKLLFIVEE